MKILSIDTSCDETAVAVTDNLNILSNIIWSQASLHAKFGGVMPSLAQREHRERIDWVIAKAIKTSGLDFKNLDAIAVTQGPGLAIALEVGISKAKELAKKYKLPLIAVNHIEGHLLSSLANKKDIVHFPALGLVVSGGTTQLIHIEKVGKYRILAETVDDALGEALDKGARLLGLGYPGGAILENIAKDGNPKSYKLPLPLIDDKIKNRFSYSGLKTAFVRLVESIKDPSRKEIANLAASYQEVALNHIIKVLEYQLRNLKKPMAKDFLLGGGVANNIALRKKLRKLCREYKIKFHVPHSKKLLSDNAAMTGIAAHFKTQRKEFIKDLAKLDREPRLRF